jgi:hypothetical protein
MTLEADGASVVTNPHEPVAIRALLLGERLNTRSIERSKVLSTAPVTTSIVGGGIAVLNERGRTEADENIEAHALDEAVDRAPALLRQQSKHKAVEIWEGPNRLYPARRKRPGRSRIFIPA